jgi:hypothetical protein
MSCIDDHLVSIAAHFVLERFTFTNLLQKACDCRQIAIFMQGNHKTLPGDGSASVHIAQRWDSRARAHAVLHR